MNENSYILSINTAERFLQLAIGSCPDADNNMEYNMITAQEWRLPGQGAEKLCPIIDDSLKRLGIKSREIKQLACVTGPGSFTGIRLALSTAAGLKRAISCQLAPLPYLELLAYSATERLKNLLDLKNPPVITAISHARRKLVHMQSFEVFLSHKNSNQVQEALAHDGSQDELLQDKLLQKKSSTGEGSKVKNTALTFSLKSHGELVVLSPEESSVLIKQFEGEALLLGSGLHRNINSYTQYLATELAKGTVKILDAEFNNPCPKSLFTFSTHAKFSDADLSPAYTRDSDAEENLEKIALSLGLDPLEARKTLTQLKQITT